MAEGMDLLEAQINAKMQCQEELVCKLTDQRENVDFLRNLVLQQQAAQQVVLVQQASQQVVPPQQPVAAGDSAMVGELKKLVGSMVTTQLKMRNLKSTLSQMLVLLPTKRVRRDMVVILVWRISLIWRKTYIRKTYKTWTLRNGQDYIQKKYH